MEATKSTSHYPQAALIKHGRDENNADCRIPLSAISDISLQSGNCVTDSQEVEIVIDSGTFATKLVFQCPGDREGMKWVQQIKKTREEYLASRWSESASVTWKRHSLNKRIVGTAEGMFRKLSKFTSSTSTELLTQDQIQALIRFGNALVFDNSVMIEVVEAVLDALNKTNEEIISQSEMTKKLGKAIAIWLGSNDVERSKSSDDVITAAERSFLQTWLKVSLDREMRRGQSDRAPSVGSAEEAPHSPTTGASADMPFRGNNSESIFLANFVKGVALKSGTLSEFLQPVILKDTALSLLNIQIAQNPENFDAKPVIVRHMSEPVARSDSSEPESPVSEPGSPVIRSTSQSRSSAPDIKYGGKLHVYSQDINDICSSLFEEVATSYDMLPKSNLMHSDVKVNPPQEHKGEAERLFCSSACGIIFLRLLCPALISPIEWGSLRDQRNKHSLSSSRSSCERKDSTEPLSSSLWSSVSDFLAIGSPSDHMTAVEELAWVDPSDESMKPSDLLRVDVGASSSALIVLAHILASSPQILMNLSAKTQNSLQAYFCKMGYEEDISKDTITAEEVDETSKDSSNSFFSMANLRHVVSTRTWSHPPAVSSESLFNSSYPDSLETVVNKLARVVALAKADEMIELHFKSYKSIVDPSTEKIVRSPIVRKSLVNLAKNVQRAANASCIPESQLEDYLRGALCNASTDDENNVESRAQRRHDHNFLLNSAVILKRMYTNMAIANP